MERHLEQLCNENPLLLTTIQNAIFSGYERSRDFVRQCGGNSISDFRVGYVRHASIEPLIFRAVEEAGFPGVTPLCRNNNGRTAKHLEIQTPWLVLMFAKVSSFKKTPPKVGYRQKTLDQFYAQQVMPGIFPIDSIQLPLYIVTHMPSRQKDSAFPATLCIGRPSVDQRSWDCCYSFNDLNLENRTIETITAKESVALKEEIVKTTSLSLKKA